MSRILLGHLGSNGDCLYATTLARQIKADYPGCHLTWAICSLARRVLDNNSDIDEIWEVPLANWTDMEHTWALFESEAYRLRDLGVFDKVFLTQISPGRFNLYDGTIRPSIFRNYLRPITVPVEVTIRLTDEEIERVERWYASSPAADASFAILFECSSKSGQSFVTPALAYEIAKRVRKERKKAAIIISSQDKIDSDDPCIMSGAALSIRETAWLTRRVDLFVGCGAGLTTAATSTAARRNLPNIQVLKRSTSMFASFRHDREYFGMPVDHFMEMTTEDSLTIAQAIILVASEGFSAAKIAYDDPVPLTFDFYLQLIDMMLVDRGKYVEAVQSLLVTAERYGWHDSLRRFAKYSVVPFLDHDPRAAFPERRQSIEKFKQAIQ